MLWHGRLALTQAFYLYLFGYLGLFVGLLAVAEAVAGLLNMPPLGPTYVRPVACGFALWASVGVWRSARTLYGTGRVGPCIPLAVMTGAVVFDCWHGVTIG